MHLADTFIPKIFISMCVPWELNPQPFALLTQCSTTEPQEHSGYILGNINEELEKTVSVIAPLKIIDQQITHLLMDKVWNTLKFKLIMCLFLR